MATFRKKRIFGLKTNHPATLVCSPTLLTGSIRRQPLKKSD
jgi:hypothetical protein